MYVLEFGEDYDKAVAALAVLDRVALKWHQDVGAQITMIDGNPAILSAVQKTGQVKSGGRITTSWCPGGPRQAVDGTWYIPSWTGQREEWANWRAVVAAVAPGIDMGTESDRDAAWMWPSAYPPR